MKKIFKNVLILSLLLLVGQVNGQEVKNTLKINPLSALIRTGSVFYERAVSDNGSIQLGLAFTGARVDESRFNGFTLTPEYRYYVKNNAPSGLYMAPFAKYQHLVLTDASDKGTYTSFGGGLMFGRQWVYKSGFVFDLFLGPAFNSGTYKQEYGNGDPDINSAIDGFGFRIGIALGLGF